MEKKYWKVSMLHKLNWEAAGEDILNSTDFNKQSDNRIVCFLTNIGYGETVMASASKTYPDYVLDENLGLYIVQVNDSMGSNNYLKQFHTFEDAHKHLSNILNVNISSMYVYCAK